MADNNFKAIEDSSKGKSTSWAKKKLLKIWKPFKKNSSNEQAKMQEIPDQQEDISKLDAQMNLISFPTIDFQLDVKPTMRIQPLLRPSNKIETDIFPETSSKGPNSTEDYEVHVANQTDIKNEPQGGIAERECTLMRNPIINRSFKKQTIPGRRNIYGQFSYADLLVKAITSTPKKMMTLSNIYDWMFENVPVLRQASKSSSWKNSIRHNLSLHNKFVKVPNEKNSRSAYWTVDLNAKPAKTTRKRKEEIKGETSKLEMPQIENIQSAPTISIPDTFDVAGAIPHFSNSYNPPHQNQMIPLEYTYCNESDYSELTPTLFDTNYNDISPEYLPNQYQQTNSHENSNGNLPDFSTIANPSMAEFSNNSFSTQGYSNMLSDPSGFQNQSSHTNNFYSYNDYSQVGNTDNSYILPGYHVSSSFRPRSRSYDINYNRLSCPETITKPANNGSPDYEINSDFRTRTWSNNSNCTRLMPIPSQEVLQDIPYTGDLPEQKFLNNNNNIQQRPRSSSCTLSNRRISHGYMEQAERNWSKPLPNSPSTSGNYGQQDFSTCMFQEGVQSNANVPAKPICDSFNPNANMGCGSISDDEIYTAALREKSSQYYQDLLFI